MSLTGGGISAMDFCWERECYDSSYMEAIKIFFAELIRSDRMQAIWKSSCIVDDPFQFRSEHVH